VSLAKNAWFFIYFAHKPGSCSTLNFFLIFVSYHPFSYRGNESRRSPHYRVSSYLKNAKLRRWLRKFSGSASPTRFIGVTDRRTNTAASAASSSHPELSSNSMRKSGRTAFSRDRTQATWRGWKTDFHLQRQKTGCRPDQQLGQSEGDEGNLDAVVRGCMRGRTMYVIPSAWVPRLQHLAYRVQITDSPYVVVSMKS